MSMQRSMHRDIGNPYMVDMYDQIMVESAMLTRGWQKKCCVLAVADCMPWATFSALLGRNINVVSN